jgi:hypothetical protein
MFVEKQIGGMDVMLHPIIYVEDFACVDIGQWNNGRVGVSLSKEAQINK